MKVLAPILCLLSLVALPAHSQRTPEPSPADLATLSVEQLMDVEIVYSAARMTQLTREAAAAVTIVTADEIRDLGYRTLGEILRGVRGFWTSDDLNYTYVGVRGFSRPADYNARMLLLINGQRMNENIYGSVLAGHENVIDVDLIDRVEIVRGPGSSVYGSNAFFCTINIVTRALGSGAGVDGSLEAGSHDSFGARARVAREFRRGGGFAISGSVYDSAGTDVYFPEFDIPGTSDGVARGIDGEEASRFFANATFGNLAIQAGYSSRRKDIPTASFEALFNEPGTYTIDRMIFAAAGYEAAVSPRTSLTAGISYGEYDYDGDWIYDYPPRVINREESDGRWLNVSTVLQFRPSPDHTILAGGEAQRDFDQQQLLYDVDPYVDYGSSRRSQRRHALFLQDDYRVSPRLRANGGLRYDWYPVFGSRWSPRVGLVFDASPRTTIKAVAGQAFREPNAYELEYSRQSPRQIPAPLLEPESIRTFELVVERMLSRNARVTLALYDNRISDLIELVTLPDDVLQFGNAGRLTSRGIEAELFAKVRSIAIRSSVSAQHTHDAETDVHLSNSPLYLAKTSWIVPIRQSSSLGLEALYASSQTTFRGDRVSGAAIVNGTARRPLGEHLDLVVGVYNLFNVQYADPASEEHVQAEIPQDGRTWRLKIAFRVPR